MLKVYCARFGRPGSAHFHENYLPMPPQLPYILHGLIFDTGARARELAIPPADSKLLFIDKRATPLTIFAQQLALPSGVLNTLSSLTLRAPRANERTNTR